MVRPIQPIGLQLPTPPVCLSLPGVRPPLKCLSPWLVRSAQIPLGVRLHCLALDTAPPPAFQPGVTAEGPSRSQHPVEPLTTPWQPWKEHPPFATQSTRWWPGEEPVDVEDVRVIARRVPYVPAPPIDWRAAGGLISFWA